MPSEIEITYNTPVYPRQVRLDTTTKCNARCLSCHRFQSKRCGEMSPELILQVLDDISRWDTPPEEIIPVNYGELFMRKDWHWVLTQISQRLPYTHIVIPTNGSFLEGETLGKLCAIPQVRTINFSVNAYFNETYETFTGLSASNLERVRKAVAYLRVMRSDIRVEVSMVFDPIYQTDLERDLFLNYWQPFAEVWILPAASAGRKSKTPELERKQPCRSIFSDFVVGFDSKLSSCCFDSNFSLDLGYYSGDLHKDWHNEKLSQLRRMHNEHKRNEINLCQSCTFA